MTKNNDLLINHPGGCACFKCVKRRTNQAQEAAGVNTESPKLEPGPFVPVQDHRNAYLAGFADGLAVAVDAIRKQIDS